MITKELFGDMASVSFNPEEAFFGGHESFALRYSWLSKGFQAFSKNCDIFQSDTAAMELGVGSNMVKSISFWLKAARLIRVESRTTPSVTDLGLLIFDRTTGADPYLEDEGTLWLIHWLIASNAKLATTYFWFFNYYHKPEFTALELGVALDDFVNDRVAQSQRSTIGTRQKAAQVMLRMYTQSRSSARAPIEDALDSPVSSLGLINHATGDRSYQSRLEDRRSLPPEIIGFAVLQLFDSLAVSSIPIEDLMFSQLGSCAPGSVFRLSENSLIRTIEELIIAIPNTLELRDSGGTNQLYLLRRLDPLDLLKNYYKMPLCEAVK